MIQGPVVLLILDGVGDGPRNAFDATFQAGTSRLSRKSTALASKGVLKAISPCSRARANSGACHSQGV